MMKAGYNNASHKELTQVLQESHYLDIDVQLLTLDHKSMKNLSDTFVDGVVSVDADAEITRALDLTLFDPFKRIHLDPDSPSKSSVYINNMIAIVVVVTNNYRTKQWEIPVFCGPINKVERNDVWLDIKCLGKESLSLTNLWRGKTFKKGQAKTTVIRQILRELVGESKMRIPSRKAKLPAEMKLNQATRPWKLARHLARGMGLQLFYNGAGVAILRKRRRKPVKRFTEQNLTDVGQPVFDLEHTINAVDVNGKKKKNKKRIGFRAVAARRTNLSPWNLGRGNPLVPRFLWEKIDDDSIRTNKEAKAVGRQRLKIGMLAGVELKASGIPDPRLEELDVARWDTDDVHATATLRKFTIPLVAGDDATYGYLKRMKPKGGKRGRRHHKKNKKNDKSRKKARR